MKIIPPVILHPCHNNSESAHNLPTILFSMRKMKITWHFACFQPEFLAPFSYFLSQNRYNILNVSESIQKIYSVHGYQFACSSLIHLISEQNYEWLVDGKKKLKYIQKKILIFSDNRLVERKRNVLALGHKILSYSFP